MRPRVDFSPLIVVAVLAVSLLGWAMLLGVAYEVEMWLT